MENNNVENICCPPFDPALWDNTIKEWTNKRFIKDKVLTFLYMPINFGPVMKRLDEKVRSANANVPDWLCLSYHKSAWGMDLLLAVDNEIPNAQNVIISGNFFCKVYEGPYNNAGKWSKDFDMLTKNQGMVVKKTYNWYTTCPKCAKKYGKNYVVILGEL
jgi:hypothetical protein